VTEQDVYLRRGDLADELDVGVRTLVRWAQQGYGPAPVKIGPRAVRYRRRDVAAFLAERAITRREAS
jgi:predicted DNA-binding transcriptional regulator AlpA